MTKVEERSKFHPRRLGTEASARLAASEKRGEMEKASMLSGIRFRNVGPEVQGGRVVDIAAPANHPDSLVAAFASGGLWRTDDRGGDWTPLFEGEPTLTIGAFALGDAEGKVIYVGTGESNSSRTSYAGLGMFKTTDGGKTWQAIGLTDTHHIGRVLVDPRDPQQAIEQRSRLLAGGFRHPFDFFQLLIHDEEQEIALVLGIDEDGTDSDAGTNGDFARGRIVEALR